MDDAKTWELIHRERTAVADTLATLTADEWARPSLCGGWTVKVVAGHIVAGGEQTKGNFAKGMLANGFRFNTMIDKAARRNGALTTTEIVERLYATATSTSRPPAPVMTMLGEVIVHGEDIRRPLGLASAPAAVAIAECLAMYSKANFPVGAKKRGAGLRLVATDVDWTLGTGPEVTGTGLSLLLAITGRPTVDGLRGEGLAMLRSRLPPIA
jgi:uncharacterized protein (TIGR03083 family)